MIVRVQCRTSLSSLGATLSAVNWSHPVIVGSNTRVSLRPLLYTYGIMTLQLQNYMECRQLAQNQTLGTRAIWHLHQEFKYGTVVGLYFIVHGYEVNNLCINYFRQWCNYKFWPRTRQEFVFGLSPQTTAFKNKILMMDMRNSPESTSHKKSYQHLA